MTDIKKKALALVEDVVGFSCTNLEHVPAGMLRAALCRAIEAHEADKQAFSDAVMRYFGGRLVNLVYWREHFARFIIARPDPLFDALKEVVELGRYDTAEQTQLLRAALDARGLEIVEKKA